MVRKRGEPVTCKILNWRKGKVLGYIAKGLGHGISIRV
jgi:hypothetical protein